MSPKHSQKNWPQPARPEAFEGPIGEFVEAVRPFTEADPHAVLIQTLVMFGNIVGRSPHFIVNATRHGLNMFTVVVGETASSRKGTAQDLAFQAIQPADLLWPPPLNGLSSGEGLIHHVRDPIVRRRRQQPPPGKEKDPGTSKDDGVEVIDPGVPDKRRLVEEPELGGVLQVIQRGGNTLSAIIRQCWDGKRLQVASKTTGEVATAPHVSLIAHITYEELTRYLDDTNLYNGFANRILWCLARRSNRLPEGDKVPAGIASQLQKRVGRVLDFGESVGEMRRSEEAKKVWDANYDRLTDGAPGLVGIVIARAAPYVMRLACCFALLDLKDRVEARHLRSALAVWDYCQASAQFIFGGRSGRPDADRILVALREVKAEGLTRREIFRDLFQGHKSAETISAELEYLRTAGHARVVVQPTRGRSIRRWCRRSCKTA